MGYYDVMEARTVNAAMYYIENKATMQETAKRFGVSASTIHQDFVQRLRHLDYDLYKQMIVQLENEKIFRADRARTYKRCNK